VRLSELISALYKKVPKIDKVICERPLIRTLLAQLHVHTCYMKRFPPILVVGVACITHLFYGVALEAGKERFS